MWATSLAIADSAYVLLVIIGGVIVMGHETLQTSYSAKDIAPRLVTRFLVTSRSLVLIAQATTIWSAGLTGSMESASETSYQCSGMTYRSTGALPSVRPRWPSSAGSPPVSSGTPRLGRLAGDWGKA
jgi:hypothetical protein